MKIFPYDYYAKHYLKLLLMPRREMRAYCQVAGLDDEFNVWYPRSPLQAGHSETLGLLRQFSASLCVFEPLRYAATPKLICTCLAKLLNVNMELEYQAKFDKKPEEEVVPKLWILAPSASDSLLAGFGASADAENGVTGIYFLPESFRSAIVVIDRLSQSPETLWIRILGRGAVQKQAMEELAELPAEYPLRYSVIKWLTNWRVNLAMSNTLDDDDRELIEYLEPIARRMRQETVEEGIGFVVENLLSFRFGSVDAPLRAIIRPLSKLPVEEVSSLVLRSSREDLLNRFGK